MSIQL
jgi:hypothetical protein